MPSYRSSVVNVVVAAFNRSKVATCLLNSDHDHDSNAYEQAHNLPIAKVMSLAAMCRSGDALFLRFLQQTMQNVRLRS